MKAVKILQAGGSEHIDIPNTLEALQKEVGGYIETVTLCPGCVMIVDEEGRLKGKAFNRKASDLSGVGIVGDALIVGVEGEEFTDVSEELVQILAHIFDVRGGDDK